jgi:hypothetical protein
MTERTMCWLVENCGNQITRLSSDYLAQKAPEQLPFGLLMMLEKFNAS